MQSGGYGDLNNEAHRVNHANRRLERVLSSLSYRLGNLIIESLRKPWLALFLPLTIIHLGFVYSMERLGRRPSPYDKLNNTIIGSRNCIIFFPTNGVGMGHMSRMVALARSVRRLNPSIEVVFFTTNYVIHHLYQMGFTCYHLPGRKKFKNMPPSEWNSICEDKLSDVIALHRPSHFVFDGTYPYRGMLNAIKGRSDIHKTWVRRPGVNSNVNPPKDSFSHFNRVIIPDDFDKDHKETTVEMDVEEIYFSPPMISVSRHDLLPSGGLRGRLGIPRDALVALVALGAGVVNEIDDIRSFVCKTLSERGVYVILADSMLNPRSEFFDDPKIRIVREYPIMQYRNCFDLAVISGGYNSVHETVFLRLPSIILPNTETSGDDQLSRALNASQNGGFIVVEQEDHDLLELAIERLCDESVRLDMINSMATNDKVIDGAPYVAESLFSGSN